MYHVLSCHSFECGYSMRLFQGVKSAALQQDIKASKCRTSGYIHAFAKQVQGVESGSRGDILTLLAIM